MKLYIDSVGLVGQNACRFIVSYLKDNALTWWRQYCATHSGVSTVFTNLTVDDLFSELAS